MGYYNERRVAGKKFPNFPRHIQSGLQLAKVALEYLGVAGNHNILGLAVGVLNVLDILVNTEAEWLGTYRCVLLPLHGALLENQRFLLWHQCYSRYRH